MSNFDLEKYRTFIKKQIIGKATYHKVDITEQLLDALCQFEKAPSSCFPDIAATIISKKYRSLFNLADKESKMHLNNWFLLKFSYKYCSKCKKIEDITNFGTNSSRVNNTAIYCKKCINYESSTWKDNNPDKVKESSKEYYSNNYDKIQKYKTDNADKIKQYQELYQKNYSNTYRLANLEARAAISANYRASKLQASPKWLSSEHKKEILAYYLDAKQLENSTGIKYHVDHIIPLQGKNVCGLHVPWNLQVITATENISKGNRYNGIQ